MMLLKTKKYYLTLLLPPLALLLTACGGSSGSSNSPEPNLERGSLVSAAFINNTPASLLRPYSVESYKIIYSTSDTEGKQIRASGLLSIPKKATSAKSPLLSYQHGTIFTDAKAPSNDTASIQGIGVLAGSGYIVSSPDYLGYAESTQILHPYVHAESLASASIDMLRASKAFLANRNTATNNQLFLAGYSEGGYATIALQKEIQDNLSTELTTTASAAGAGPYDLSESAKFLANKVTNDNPSYMNFVVKAYDSVYKLNKIDEMYQAPYRDIINSYFDGSRSGGQINTALSSTTADLFNSSFLALLQGSGTHPLKDVLASNDIYDWKPSSPTRLYHGILDEIVPYSNSTKALEKMLENGSRTVSLRDCPVSGHVNCAVPYVFDALNFFSTYVEDL